MLILDENFRLEQQDVLVSWRIRTRKIGKDLAAFGTADADLIPLLLPPAEAHIIYARRRFLAAVALASSLLPCLAGRGR
ncbi:MAG: hypothetical protein ABI680_10295 [Chthoniobacteraceae bacterium]